MLYASITACHRQPEFVDTFRGDLPSARSWGFGIRKTTPGPGNRVALPVITLVSPCDPWDRPSAILPGQPTSGTEDDDDDRDDEHAGENEAPVRAFDEGTETPEEFEVDDKR